MHSLVGTILCLGVAIAVTWAGVYFDNPWFYIGDAVVGFVLIALVSSHVSRRRPRS